VALNAKFGVHAAGDVQGVVDRKENEGWGQGTQGEQVRIREGNAKCDNKRSEIGFGTGRGQHNNRCQRGKTNGGSVFGERHR